MQLVQPTTEAQTFTQERSHPRISLHRHLLIHSCGVVMTSDVPYNTVFLELGLLEWDQTCYSSQRGLQAGSLLIFRDSRTSSQGSEHALCVLQNQ